MIPLRDKRLLLQFLYPRWRPPRGSPRDGFSILLPMPSDLPVFFRIAMKVLEGQDLENANEIVIVADIPRASFADMVRKERPSVNGVPIVLAEMEGLRRTVARLYNRPNHYHWAQIVCGLEHARSSRALLHDADMFLLDPSFLESQYAAMVRDGFRVMGISPAWDHWFSENGYRHVTATWEMLLDVEWARSFPPVLLHGHVDDLEGRRHTFDTTYYAQCLSDPRAIGYRDRSAGFVHFNWLISGYRLFERHRRDYCDDHFTLMILRLLLDEFDADRPYPGIPSWDLLASCLLAGRGPVGFPSAETRGPTYRNTRAKLAALFGSPLVAGAAPPDLECKLEPFDRYYGFTPGSWS
jgi:hypothetical protein